ncbi:MAG: histidine kinase dimerization/phospho-acceptor domain-containing protein [Cyanobacteriota bacterium]
MSNLEENSFEEKENNNTLEEKTNSVTIKYRNILIFIFFTLVISLSLISYVISLKNNANFVYLDNWEYTENVKEENNWIKISEPKNPVGIKNKSLLFKTELPNVFFKEPCVFIYSIDQLFEVYLDNKLIYSFGDLDQKPVFLGYPINFISLEKYDYKGKELKIKVYSNHTNIGLNGKIKFGERESLFRKVIFDDIDKFIYASIFIMLGIISFALFFTSKNKEKIYINFGFFSLLTGLYAVAHNSITRLLVDNLVLLMYLDLFFLYALPAFYNFFVEEIATKSKKVFSLMGYTFLAYAFISLFLAYNNEVKLMSTLAPFHILLILNTIGILIYISFKAMKGKREARIFLLGNAIFLITVFYDINNYIRINEEQYVLHNIGILALFSSIIIIIIERYAKIYTLVSVYYNDLKYQKELQKKLQDAHDSAIENARLKADFLANMSHEIRTPINGVIGMTELLLKTKLDTTQKEFLDIIRISSKNLLEIINNILDFSKIEANKVELDIIEVNINTIIEEVIVSQSLQAYEKGLELMYFIDPKVPETIKTDPIRLKQILTNLFSNSVKSIQLPVVQT